MRRVVLLMPLLTLAACGNTTPTPDSAQTFREEWLRRLPGILRDTSAFQRQILEDGQVTAAEHERARLAFIGCIEDAGVRITDLELDEHGQIDLLGVAGEGADATVKSCEETFYGDVREAWRVAIRPDDTEETFLGRIAACMAENGYRVSSDPANYLQLKSEAEGIGPDAEGQLIECTNAVQ
ncbi:MAG: hypothetical protein KatS3mg065_0742 [Chloroflexota bacterium]|nr:MAG: hypothetical protein KatS3mg065_0742 [Chloroflexota bacterium]